MHAVGGIQVLLSEHGPAGLMAAEGILCRRSSGSCLRCKTAVHAVKFFIGPVVGGMTLPMSGKRNRWVLFQRYTTKPIGLDTAIGQFAPDALCDWYS